MSIQSSEIIQIILLSIRITLISVIISSAVGIPLAYWIDNTSLKVRKLMSALMQSLTAVPTVVVGLVVYSFVSRRGLLGGMGLLFNPEAIIIGQSFLGIPIVITYLLTGFSRIDVRLKETLVTLGAGSFQMLFTILSETRFILLSAFLGSFGRIIGEVGVSMMLGGNIRYHTRTMTTAIALETSKGEFESAMILGGTLLLIAVLVNFSGHLLIKRIR